MIMMGDHGGRMVMLGYGLTALFVGMLPESSETKAIIVTWEFSNNVYGGSKAPIATSHSRS